MAKKSRNVKPKGTKQRTKPDIPGALPSIGDNSGKVQRILTDDEKRELFLHHRTKWNQLRAKRAVHDDNMDEFKADLKADGFTLKQMKIADELADIKGEAKVKSEVSDRLQVALWIGHPLGAQLDLFAQPDRTPSDDVAYDAGKMCSMENRPARPPYDPSTSQYQKFMAGFHDHQRQLAGGLKAAEDVNQSTLAN